MMKQNPRQFLPLLLLLGGLALYLSGQVSAEIAARDIPNAPDWDDEAPKLISIDQVGPDIADRPYIAAAPNGNTLIIVYNRRMSAGNDKDPYFSRSTNGGQSWTSPAPIHISLGTAFNSLEVNLDIDASDTGHAVWVEEDTKIRYSREPNWGNNNPVPIDEVIFQASSPQIIASGSNTLDIIWTAADSGNSQVFHRRSTNGGNNWSAENFVSPANVEALYTDFAIDDNGILHLVWEQTYVVNAQQGSYIYYTRGTPSGPSINWSTPARIGDVSGDPDESGPIGLHDRSARRPIILAADGRLHVAFTTHWQSSSQWIHYVTCSSACQNSQNWSDDTSISGKVVGANAIYPIDLVSDIFSVRGCVHVYFHGITDTLEDNELILGVNSCDNWASLGRDVVTQPQTQSLHTSAVLTDEFIHMVYEQTGNQGTTRQIYYRRGLPPPFALYLPFTVKD